MATVIVVFNLKDGVDPAAYEKWARERDSPTVNALASIDSFRLLRATGVIGSEASAPYQYVEVVEINSMEQFMTDIAAGDMPAVAAEFQEFADNPTFILTKAAA
jgi:hypothetical protein